MSTDGADTDHGKRLTAGIVTFVVAAGLGIVVASLVPQVPEAVHTALAVATGAEPAPPAGDEAARKRAADPNDERAEIVRLTGEQIEAAGIELAPVQDGKLVTRILAPGTIVPHADRIARVSVKLSATVAELRKKLGDRVAKDEVMAVLESREVASAKSEYLAARLSSDLAKDLYDRDKDLWDRRVTSEQLLLRSRAAAAQARMSLDIARQKLFAIGLTEKEVAALPEQPETALRRQEVRAPLAGRVVDRKVDLGAAVGRDNLETELFTIADLDRVWVDLAVSPTDLPLVREGLTVTVAAHGLAYRAVGNIVFISPMLDREAHSARVVAEIANSDGNWRPGSLVHATIDVGEYAAPLAVPTSAVQTIGKGQVVFVRTADGFEKRMVSLGHSDDRISEIVAGLAAGETIAVTNTFALKAEFLKSLAED
jgi:membrane fusion protein, heavy metal efflux system